MLINAKIEPLKGGEHEDCRIAVSSLPEGKANTLIFLGDLVPEGYKLLSYKVLNPDGKRLCLNCQSMFKSAGPSNRICSQCIHARRSSNKAYVETIIKGQES